MEIDFDSIDPAGTGDYPVLPEGTYQMDVIKAEEIGGDKPHIKLQLQYINDEGKQFMVFDRIYMHTPGCLKVLKVICERMKFPITGKRNVSADMFLGKTVEIDVTHEEYPAGSGKFNAKADHFSYKLVETATTGTEDEIPF